MTKEQLAEHLDGREYPLDFTREESKAAKEAGLVVVYGQSDDLVEIDGAVRDEGGGCGDFDFQLNRTGIVSEPDDDEREVLEKYGVLDAVKAKGGKIKALWNRHGISWQYQTAIPHATFHIQEEGETYCIGIVFDAKELEATNPAKPEGAR